MAIGMADSRLGIRQRVLLDHPGGEDRLHVLTTEGAAGPFARQAGVAEAPAQRARAAPALRPVRHARCRGATVRRPARPAASRCSRPGAKSAVQVAASRAAGPRIAAWAIRHNLVNGDAAAGDACSRDYTHVTGMLRPSSPAARRRSIAEASTSGSSVRRRPRCPSSEWPGSAGRHLVIYACTSIISVTVNASWM